MIIFLIYVIELFSQADIIKFDHISLEQGLSQNSVFCIIQDQKGFMWFGTEDGLNRYDGYEFEIHKNDLLNHASISDSYILSIHEDRAGIIWIGTDGGGLNKFDKNKKKFVRYISKPNHKNGLSNNRVFSICEDFDM